jgi:hypothetical protein
MNHGHFVTKCKHCKHTVNTCRCMSKDKHVNWTVCPACMRKAFNDHEPGEPSPESEKP